MKIITGIVSTTHVDHHGEIVTKEALLGMAEQINKEYKPYLIEHDWDKQIGVVLYGEVFKLLDGEHALGGVFGIFENSRERNEFKNNKENKSWKKYKKYLNTDELVRLANNNSKDITMHTKDNTGKELGIGDMLEAYLNSTKVLSDGRVYKIKKLIATAKDLRIEVYPKDHLPPHFHVISKQRNIDARFSIETLELISTKRGRIRESDIKKIQDFFNKHPQSIKKLKDEYNRLL